MGEAYLYGVYSLEAHQKGPDREAIVLSVRIPIKGQTCWRQSVCTSNYGFLWKHFRLESKCTLQYNFKLVGSVSRRTAG